jgi:hypothetical protein
MNYFFIPLSFLLIISMGCLGSHSASSAGDSFDSIDEGDFEIGDPGFENMEDDPIPVDVSSQ